MMRQTIEAYLNMVEHVPFKLKSEFEPQGDQPQAIQKIVKGINEGKRHQTLLGATGTGKTFTMSNVIKEVGKPTLIIAHNKTLAGQLYSEFKEFFQKIESNILLVIMITIIERMLQLMMKSTSYAQVLYLNAMMLLLSQV